MKIFVTGATGFIGSSVVDELLRRGHTVVGLARSEASAGKLRAKGAEAHRGSIDDTASILSALDVVDGVIHVTGKDRLTRLHDRNGDGEADYYESFHADQDVSMFFHAFNFDLHTDDRGWFYYAKSGQYTSRLASSCESTYRWRRLAASGLRRGDKRAGACGIPARSEASASVSSLAFFSK